MKKNKILNKLYKICLEGKTDIENRRLANEIYLRIVNLEDFYPIEHIVVDEDENIFGSFQLNLEDEDLPIMIDIYSEFDTDVPSPYYEEDGQIYIPVRLSLETANRVQGNPEEEKKLLQNIIRNEKSTLIHEIIHFLDYKRSKEWGATGEKGTDYYVNHPAEFNAFFQSLVQKFEDDYLDEEDMENFDKFYSKWKKFIKEDIEAISVFNYLNEDRQKRVYKRINQLYSDLKQASK